MGISTKYLDTLIKFMYVCMYVCMYVFLDKSGRTWSRDAVNI